MYYLLLEELGEEAISLECGDVPAVVMLDKDVALDTASVAIASASEAVQCEFTSKKEAVVAAAGEPLHEDELGCVLVRKEARPKPHAAAGGCPRIR